MRGLSGTKEALLLKPYRSSSDILAQIPVVICSKLQKRHGSNISTPPGFCPLEHRKVILRVTLASAGSR